jgi:hypothetical protein
MRFVTINIAIKSEFKRKQSERDFIAPGLLT